MDASERPRLVILDAMSLIHRAYHAVPRHFATSSGEPTNAVFGFMNILLRVVEELSPDHAAAAFDLPGPTFRDELYEPYKAHREAPDDMLVAQFGRIRELLEVLGIPIYDLEPYEADDVLGTLARQAEADGFDVWLITGDRDALQLVTPHVRVLSTNPRTGQPLVYDEGAIADRWGIKASQVVDFKGLVGDSSDNIPGVKGVGEKTASTLLATYDDIDDIYAHLEDIRPAIRRRLEGQEEIAQLSRRLATIVCDVPVEFDAERTRLWQADVVAVQALMRELQFRNVVERMAFLDTSAREEAEALEVEPAVVTDAEGASALAGQLASAERVAVFPYARGSSWSVELLGLGLAWGNETAYVSLDGEGGPLDALKGWLEDERAGKAAFDSKLLHSALASRAVALRGVEADLLLAAYVATPSAIPRTLDDLVFRRKGLEVEPALPDAQVAGGLMRPDPEDAALPAALRAALALGLADEMDAEIDDLKLTGLLHDVEMPLALVLSEMERRGIRLDAGALGELSREMAEEIAELQSGIYTDAGHEFNVNSPKQLGTVLFEELGLPAGRRTKTGYSTASGVLEGLVDDNPIVGRVLEYRELSKLKSTYIDTLPDLAHPSTGRLHTTFNQAGTATGRLSSANPNLQNIPIRTARGREIRRAFVAGREGWTLLAIDYSQIDLRVLAHISEDAAMCEAFANGHDIHSSTAASLHGVSLDEVTEDMRRLAKTTNFGIVYGISAQGLASRTEFSRQEAAKFIETYFATYPGVKGYMDSTIALAHDRGYVETLFQRRRYLPELNSRAFHERAAAERMAINMPIQGTTADIMKIAMVKLDRAIREQRFAAQMLLQVHDDLLFELPAEELDDFAGVARELMTNAVPLHVPLAVDAKTGPNWRDMVEI
ncbi:MAG: DNA polymerase I [Chloroflexota bacterium]|nr:DNA polymerase I [Chloroflexota bacterium]